MIFKKLFRPAWQHSDPSKRQSAIAGLDTGNQQHRTILREMAFNDGHRQVRKAALEKLNELSLWWLAAGEERDDGLKKQALHQVTEMITSPSPSDPAQVKAFVADCKDRKFLESVWRQLPDNRLRQTALTRIDKARCFFDAAEKELDSVLALWAAEKISDEKQMRRLMKRAALADVQCYFEQTLAASQQAKELPAQLNEQARLLLAQLQDITDRLIEPQAFEQPALGDKVSELDNRWQALAAELTALDLLAQWQAKYQQITSRMAPRLTELKGIWQQATAKAEQQQLQQDNAAMLQGGFAALQQDIQTIHTQIEEQQPYDIQPLAEVLQVLQQELASQTLTEQDWAALSKQAAALSQQIAALTDLPAQLASADALIEQLRSIDSDADSFLDDFSAWRKAWREVSALPLPASSKALLSELLPSLEQAKKARVQARKAAESQVEKLLSKAERHQAAGRLKVAVREFHRLAKTYAELDERIQRRLEKRYSKLAEVERELLEWHQYVALPKADGLLAEIKALAEAPLADAKAQADAVKDARRRWQLLEVDRNEASWLPLAEQFDQLSEQAFEICRQFYAEQQQEREQHLAEREQLIEAMKALAESHKATPLSLNDLESQYRQIVNSWRQAGEVDFTKRKVVQSRYLKASRRVSERLKQLYSVNEALKQQLLTQAEGLNLSDVAAASDVFDSLMKQWREVGYAGGNEKSLWQRFQQIGQQLREQRNTSRDQQRSEWQANAQQFENALSGFAAALSAAKDDAGIYLAIEQVKETIAAIGELAHKDRRRLESELDALYQQAEQQLAERQKLAEQDNYQKLIEAVTPGNEDLLLALPERWRKMVRQWQQHGADKPADADVRERLTIEAELLAGLDSPKESDTLRQQLRLSLLQAHMNGGESRSVESLFWKWLEAGAVTAADKPALQRFQRALSA